MLPSVLNLTCSDPLPFTTSICCSRLTYFITWKYQLHVIGFIILLHVMALSRTSLVSFFIKLLIKSGEDKKNDGFFICFIIQLIMINDFRSWSWKGCCSNFAIQECQWQVGSFICISGVIRWNEEFFCQAWVLTFPFVPSIYKYAFDKIF